MNNLIAISLSPNTEKKDIFLALKLIFSPWKWLKGKKIEELEAAFRHYFKIKFAVSFKNGRSAEYAILKSMGVKNGDEVLIQAFTCVVVPNPILWLGAKPVYVDFEEESLNMDPRDLKKKITAKSKVIIVQHTFGKPAKIKQIMDIAKNNKLFLIEDCAHSLGAQTANKKLGTYGDAAFFSFGRDKVISSVFGGIAITNNNQIGQKLLKIKQKANFPSRFWVFQQLFHPIAFSFILSLYNFLGLGKVILFGLQKIGLLSRAVSPEEKMTQQPKNFLTKLPNALASLALFQFQRLEEFNQKRRKISDVYRKRLVLQKLKPLVRVPGEIDMRYTLISQEAGNLLEFAKKRGILLGDWYQQIIDPKGVNLKKAGYVWGSCPAAEKIAKNVINLPTYPRMKIKEAEKVVNLLKEYFKEK